MTSNISQSSFQSLSLCAYIGNTSSFDDQIIINYCSQFGKIVSCSIDNCPNEKRPFCDFRIIEFSTKQQLEYFLNISSHHIGSITLDVKLYKNIFNNFDILNIDRKLFIGPILNTNDINIIVEFYKIIDPRLKYNLSRQDKQTYILIEFSNRQYIRAIIQQKTIPKTIDNQIFNIHTAVHPKELIKKNISKKNSHCQICINGLNDKITETMLIDYFDKRAPVVACHILSMDPQCAIIEFQNEKFVQKFLDIRVINLYGTNLSLSKVSSQLTSILPFARNDDKEKEYSNDQVHHLLQTTGSTTIPSSDLVRHSPAIQNKPIASEPISVQQVNMNQQQLMSNFYFQAPCIVLEPLPAPSPEITECGWISPPRAVVNHCLPVDKPSERLSSNPCPTTTDINKDSIYQSRVIEIDTKSFKNIKSNLLNFTEQFQNEIEQIKDEYMMKFTKDRTLIEHEMNRLMNDERITFNKVNRRLYEHRRRSSKSYEKKRKYS